MNEEKRRSKNLMIYGCREKGKETDFEVTKTVKDVFDERIFILCPKRVNSTGLVKRSRERTGRLRLNLEVPLT